MRRLNLLAALLAVALPTSLATLSRSTPRADAPPAPATARDLLADLPVAFEPVGDQGFVSRGPGYSLALSPSDAVVAVGDARFRLRPAGPTANPAAELVPGGALPGTVSRIQGTTRPAGRGGLSTFARVEARQVWPGVDMVWHGNGRALEHDMVVAPGTDPGRGGARRRRGDVAHPRPGRRPGRGPRGHDHPAGPSGRLPGRGRHAAAGARGVRPSRPVADRLPSRRVRHRTAAGHRPHPRHLDVPGRHRQRQRVRHRRRPAGQHHRHRHHGVGRLPPQRPAPDRPAGRRRRGHQRRLRQQDQRRRHPVGVVDLHRRPRSRHGLRRGRGGRRLGLRGRRHRVARLPGGPGGPAHERRRPERRVRGPHRGQRLRPRVVLVHRRWWHRPGPRPGRRLHRQRLRHRLHRLGRLPRGEPPAARPLPTRRPRRLPRQGAAHGCALHLRHPAGGRQRRSRPGRRPRHPEQHLRHRRHAVARLPDGAGRSRPCSEAGPPPTPSSPSTTRPAPR